jgi:hypothetical protein
MDDGQCQTCGLAFDDQVILARPLGGKSSGPLHNSRKVSTTLARPFNRPIGLGATQSVHPSVLERWDKTPSYRLAIFRLTSRRLETDGLHRSSSRLFGAVA